MSCGPELEARIVSPNLDEERPPLLDVGEARHRLDTGAVLHECHMMMQRVVAGAVAARQSSAGHGAKDTFTPAGASAWKTRLGP